MHRLNSLDSRDSRLKGHRPGRCCVTQGHWFRLLCHIGSARDANRSGRSRRRPCKFFTAVLFSSSFFTFLLAFCTFLFFVECFYAFSHTFFATFSCKPSGSYEPAPVPACKKKVQLNLHLKVHLNLHMNLKLQMKLYMNLFLHKKGYVTVQVSLRVRVHEGWGPTSEGQL